MTIGVRFDDFLDEFMMAFGCMRLLQEDSDLYSSMIAPMAKSLHTSRKRWGEFTNLNAGESRMEDHLLRSSERVLQKLTAMINYPWPNDAGPIFDELGGLNVEILVHLAHRLKSRRTGVEASLSADVEAGIHFCIRAIHERVGDPTLIQSALRLRLLDPFPFSLVFVLDEFDTALLMEFNTALLKYLAHPKSDSSEQNADHLRRFLCDSAVVFWKDTIQHYRGTKRDDQIIALASEILPKVFESIANCQKNEPIDVIPRLLDTVALLPVTVDCPIRKGLKVIIENVVTEYIKPWADRAENDPVFRRKYEFAMQTIRPGLDGKERTNCPVRFNLGNHKHLNIILAPEELDELGAGSEQKQVTCRVVDISRNISGIKFIVNKVVNSDEQLWAVFPDGTLKRLDECRVFVKYCEDDGRIRHAMLRFICHWTSPRSEGGHTVGGHLDFLTPENTVDQETVCRSLQKELGFEFLVD